MVVFEWISSNWHWVWFLIPPSLSIVVFYALALLGLREATKQYPFVFGREVTFRAAVGWRAAGVPD